MTAMTIIAAQTPWTAVIARVERPVPSSNALPPVETVAPLPENSAQGLLAGRPAFQDSPQMAFAHQQGAANPADAQQKEAQPPFPELHFADPLPNLPDLDLTGMTQAYHTALSVLRGTEGA
jgi:hypothetical protein